MKTIQKQSSGSQKGSNKKTEFRVTALTDSMEAQITDLKNKIGLSKNKDLLEFLLQTAQQSLDNDHNVPVAEFTIDDLPLNSELLLADYDNLTEYDLVAKAVDKIGLNQFIQNAIMTESKKVHSGDKPLTSSGKIRIKTSSAAILNRLKVIVDEQITANNNTDDKVNMRHINAGWLMTGGICDELGRPGPNKYNYKTCARYIQSRADELDEHHNRLGLSGTHKMWVVNELKRKLRTEVADLSAQVNAN